MARLGEKITDVSQQISLARDNKDFYNSASKKQNAYFEIEIKPKIEQYKANMGKDKYISLGENLMQKLLRSDPAKQRDYDIYLESLNNKETYYEESLNNSLVSNAIEIEKFLPPYLNVVGHTRFVIYATKLLAKKFQSGPASIVKNTGEYIWKALAYSKRKELGKGVAFNPLYTFFNPSPPGIELTTTIDIPIANPAWDFKPFGIPVNMSEVSHVMHEPILNQQYEDFFKQSSKADKGIADAASKAATIFLGAPAYDFNKKLSQATQKEITNLSKSLKKFNFDEDATSDNSLIVLEDSFQLSKVYDECPIPIVFYDARPIEGFKEGYYVCFKPYFPEGSGDLTQAININWDAQPMGHGRTEPIYRFNSVTHAPMTLTFIVWASDPTEHEISDAKLELLNQMSLPHFYNDGRLKAAPAIRLQIGNLLYDYDSVRGDALNGKRKLGLPIILNSISTNHNASNGWDVDERVLKPMMRTVTISFTPVYPSCRGYVEGFGHRLMSHSVALSNRSTALKQNL